MFVDNTRLSLVAALKDRSNASGFHQCLENFSLQKIQLIYLLINLEQEARPIVLSK